MSSSMASNAILAKARAMYGKCLSDNDYRQLMDCRNVSEVASYLKSRTNYKSVLAGLNENEVHRGQLEPILKQNLYYDISALSRYARDKSLVFSNFIISEMEIEQIIRCLTLLNIGRADEFVFGLPMAMTKFAKIDLKAFSTVRSYDDLLSVISSSKYAPVLRKYRPKEGERADISMIEAELNNQNYGMVIEAISQAKSARDRDELRDTFSAMLDFRNISRIIRLKRYYNYTAEKIFPLLIPYGKLSRKALEELCSASSSREVFELARSTYLGRLMSKLKYSDQSQMANALLSMYCKHHLRLSANPTIVMISYVYLKQIELTNIVNIIESTRYGLSPEEKSAMLVR